MPVIRTPPTTPQGCCTPTSDMQAQLTTVRSTLVGPDGRPLAGREVVAVLRASPTWLEDGTGRVIDTARTRTDREGQWEMRLLPNKYLEPPTNESGKPTPTSYYEISENGLVSTALVPGAGEHTDCPRPQEPCTVWLRDILINGPQPGPVPWAPIDTLGKLHNVTPDADDPKRGQVLVFNGQVWEPKTTQAGSGPTRLDELEDVDARNPTQGQTLTYQDQEWVAGTPTTSLNTLEDVEAPNPEQDQVLVFNGRVWTPGRAVTDLASLEDVDATNLTSGYALIFNGRVWEPGPVATRLDGLADVDTTTPPTSGQVLTYQNQSWAPITPREELALLNDIHPSIAVAEPGDALIAVEHDPNTGRMLWGVDREIPHLELRFGGSVGSMTAHCEVSSPDVTTTDIQIQWEGTPNGPTTVLVAGMDYTATHTYTEPGTYTIVYRYVDDSDSSETAVTVPWETTSRRRHARDPV